MIHRLRHMIGSAQVAQSHPTLGYVRAVPAPFHGGLLDRLRDAAAVVRGEAYAVTWPRGGELERALCEGVDVGADIERARFGMGYGRDEEGA